MAGERECETGCPSTARRFIRRPSAPAVRGRATGVRGGDELVELLLAGREAMVTAAVAVHHIEEVVDLGRVSGRLDRGESRIADRRRGQAGVGSRVVRRGGLQLGLGDLTGVVVEL